MCLLKKKIKLTGGAKGLQEEISLTSIFLKTYKNIYINLGRSQMWGDSSARQESKGRSYLTPCTWAGWGVGLLHTPRGFGGAHNEEEEEEEELPLMRTPSWAQQRAPRLEGWGDHTDVLVQGMKTGGKPSWTSIRPKQNTAPSPSRGEQSPFGSHIPPGCAGMDGIPSPLHTHATSNLINKSKTEVLHVEAKHY